MKLSSLAVLVSAAVATALSATPLAYANDGTFSTSQVSIDNDASATRWFVELSGPPTIHGVTPAAVGREQAAFRKAARDAGLEFEERFQYQTLWNGFSVETSPGQAAMLRAVPGVRAIYPVIEFDAPPRPDSGSIGDVEAAIAQTRSDIARSELGLTGNGVKVAIIDTGIDYDHPDLGGCFGPGCKVAYGYDFVGNAYNAGDPNNNVPIPGDDPDDCNGHGTHVAGIVGASAASEDGVTGVAPDVTLGAYKVFGCVGSSSADVIIAALERAYADGMDIVNQSLGAAFQWPQYPTSTVGDRLVQQGVVVIASAGNSGATGTFSIGAPGVGHDVIGVASFDNAMVLSAFLEAGDRSIAHATMTFSSNPPTAGNEEFVFIGQACNADGPLLADPDGKVALAVRGACAFAEKAQNAVNAGATAVIIHNSAPGQFFGTLGAPPAHDVPVVSISGEDGVYLRDLEVAELTWKEGTRRFPNPTGGLISSFSSWGLSPDLQIKPDLGAPGGAIYATFPLELGGYATLSGTSMSAPHVAGAAALLLEARPDTVASNMRDILQNTSVPAAFSLNPGLPVQGFAEPVHRQGAGMIDIVAAIESPLHVSPGKLSLGEGEAGPHAVQLTISNSGSEPVTLTPSFFNAITTTRSIPDSGTFQSPGPNPGLGFFGSSASVQFAVDSVTVPAGGQETLSAVITPTGGPDGRIYGGYIAMTPADGGLPLHVPFAGFTGDYQSVQPLNGSPFGLPWLAKLAGPSYSNQPEGATYTLADGDVPYFLVHFGHHVERLEFQVVHATNERPVHPVFANFVEIDYIGRVATKTGFFAFTWNGTRFHSAGNSDLFKVVPNGEYKVNIRALKAAGDASNPDHWQVWTSPTITIDRPEEPKKTTINERGQGRR